LACRSGYGISVPWDFRFRNEYSHIPLRSTTQLVEQRLGVLEIERIETFGEPVVDFTETVSVSIADQPCVATIIPPIELSIPRDRHGRFDPVLIGKYRRRFGGFDEKIIALYARGMTTREIAEHIGELYGAEISADLVSAVTDSVLEEVAAWQSRGLDATYAIVFFDAIRVKIRNEGMVSNRAVYLAIGVRCSGHKEILGIWIEQTEGAKFWLRVMTELRNRGIQDILIAVVDGLKGFPEAITSVFPKTVVQT